MTQTPPQPSTPPGGPAAQPPAGGPVPPVTAADKSDCTLGMLAHLLGIVGFLGPLIIWLIKKDESKFLNQEGRESLNFQLTLLIGWVVVTATFCLHWGVLHAALWVADLIFCILGAMKGNTGQPYRYPVCIRFIK